MYCKFYKYASVLVIKNAFWGQMVSLGRVCLYLAVPVQAGVDFTVLC
jgi:hypothetical protein